MANATTCISKYSRGIWFRSPAAALRGTEASARLLSRIGATAALSQLEEIV